jgi:uncharacterized protein (TIGR02271 family)
MQPEQGYWEIDNGWDVLGSDGEKLGDVSDVQSEYITVSKGFLFKTDRYVPVTAISAVDNQRVYLNLTKDQIDRPEYEAVPPTGVYQGLGGERDTELTTGMRSGTTTRGSRTVSTDEDTVHVPVVEEDLQVTKRETERGQVRVHKDVVEEQRRVDVPLREEEVRVERRAVNEPYDADGEAFREMDIEIPIRGEEAEISKRPVVREEVDISKQQRKRDRKVSGKVRREEVRVEGTEGVTPQPDVHEHRPETS